MSIFRGMTESQSVEELLNVLFNDMPDLIIFKDGEGRWISASKFAQSLYGLENIEYVGKTSQELSQYVQIKQYRNILLSRQEVDENTWRSGKMTRSEVEYPPLNGRSVVLDVISTPLFNNDGSRNALVVIGRDITEQKIAEKKNLQLAFYDQLTNLPNRFKFENELKKHLVIASALQQSFVVMSLDIDRFKYIYDSLGPLISNQLLILISKRLNKCIQKDWILAYMGEDQFAILIPAANATEEITNIAQKLIDSISEVFIVNEYELFTTMSIGICSFPQDGEEIQSLLKHADIALNLAKEKGRNRYQVYGAKMDVATFKAFTLENDLKKAKSLNQFEIYYQPKIDVCTSRIIGAEALIRWNHPEWGLISPKEFIPIAEETGLIVQIGEWVKETVCKQLREWQDSGIEVVPISVNISAKRFLKKNFIYNVKRILQEVDIDPSLLEIEITESSFLENEELAIEVINELRNSGIKVLLDDFGTGYSALSYLRQFKVDAIKIDRSFIKEICVNKKDELVTKGIIQLIQSLEINVIAEGVESIDQLRYLSKLNCNHVQGYLFSRPVQMKEFTNLLKEGHIEACVQRNERNRESVNPRKYYRIHFTYPLLADMTIIKFMGKDITLGKTEVLIENIGLGGLSLISNIKMAERVNMDLSVETNILGMNMNFIGKIVWCEEIEEDIYQYGMEFLIDEEERDSIAKVLHPLSAKLRNNPILPDCRFINTDARSFFSENK